MHVSYTIVISCLLLHAYVNSDGDTVHCFKWIQSPRRVVLKYQSAPQHKQWGVTYLHKQFQTLQMVTLQMIMFWPIVPIIFQPFRWQYSHSVLINLEVAIPYHVIKQIKLVLLASCSPLKRMASNLESHSSKHLTM